MRKFITIIALSIMTLVTMTSSDKAFTIYLIGDSTMANKNIEKDGRERGWGMALQGFFAEEVFIDNRALNGRSSKTFIDEGHWQKVLNDIKPGDYLVIQFGHNDEKGKVGDKKHTIAGLTFDDNIRTFCRGALGDLIGEHALDVVKADVRGKMHLGIAAAVVQLAQDEERR